jgi:trehalose-phosphatase
MEMQNHLEQNIVGKLPVECLAGKMTVEMKPSLVNKGAIIKRALTQNPETEFILCAGDDKTDEDMFRILERIELGGTSIVQFAVVVGSPDSSRKTMANWKVDSSQEFVQVLGQLADQ